MTPLASLLASSSLFLLGTGSQADSNRAEAEPSAEGSASGEISLGGGAKGDKKASKKKKKDKGAKDKKVKKDKGAKQEDAGTKTRWIRRWPPERNMLELGVFGGVYLPGANHELFEPSLALPDQGFRPLATVAPEVGLRFSYLPLRVLGLEVEGAVMPTSAENGESATLWTVRGGVIGQLPYWSVTPFLVLGAGALGVSSDRNALGNDVDPSMYFGGGTKFYLSRRTQIRLDLRDVVSHKQSVDATFQNHNFEALLSFALVLNRHPAPPPPPADTDGDGFLDTYDACVNEPGVAPDGCPIRDKDGDGFLDAEDACVDEPGVAPDGCPVKDSDGDGFMDPNDACVDEAGVAPDGCPIRDTDGDGIFDDVDGCIDEPETVNAFEDGDGCPDEVPEEVQRFTGVIEGIKFDSNKATIRKKSAPTLDAAAEVLLKYPDLIVEISGHTDNKGGREHNIELSLKRADSVREYLIAKGVAESHIRTRGAGPDEPIGPNSTKGGRARNRRIEFAIVGK